MVSDSTLHDNAAENTTATSYAERSGGLSTVSSASLLQGRREIRIDHRGEVYCLRETKNGKLILTK